MTPFSLRLELHLHFCGNIACIRQTGCYASMGFQADELLSESQPNFNELLDPKCDWALHHLEHFPVEVEKASYATLLRVPGIGPKSASRITYARQYGRLNFDNLKRMGVVLKRAHYFITCGGRQMYRTPIEEAYITRQLVQVDAK